MGEFFLNDPYTVFFLDKHGHMQGCMQIKDIIICMRAVRLCASHGIDHCLHSEHLWSKLDSIIETGVTPPVPAALGIIWHIW